MKIIKRLVTVAAVLLLVTPTFAVFNEKDLSETISVLRYELKLEYVKLSNIESGLRTLEEGQHQNLIDILKRCNELSLMLYSQGQDCTFDMAYALGQVTKEYEDFNANRMPYDAFIESLEIEVERYSRLLESLRRLPPVLKDIEDLPDSLKYRNDSLDFNDSLIPYDESFTLDGHKIEDLPIGTKKGKTAEGHLNMYVDSLSANGSMLPFFLDAQAQDDRDSCISYASAMLLKCIEMRDAVSRDNEFYEDAGARLKESYDYAQERYRTLQKSLFGEGKVSYFEIIKYFDENVQAARDDNRDKYSNTLSGDETFAKSEWRGPKVLGLMGVVVFYLLFASCIAVAIFTILKKKSKKMQTAEFRYRLPLISALCGTVIFALTVTIIAVAVKHNFLEVASRQLLVLSWLLAAIQASMLIRLKGKEIKNVIKLYLPIVAVSLMVITLRIVFLPNSVISILFPPFILIFFVWQFIACAKRCKETSPDTLLGWISLIILFVSTVLSWLGLYFMGIEVVIWWLFMEACIETILALNTLLEKYRFGHIESKSKTSDIKGVSRMGINWFYDFLKKTVLPILTIMMIPFTIYLAFNVFDLKELFDKIVYSSFFDLKGEDGEQILTVSLYMLVLTAVLFFIFRYVDYIAKSIYREAKIISVTRQNGKKYVRTNEINFTLVNNVISILVWGSYIIMMVFLLKIPTGAVSLIAAGLATGLGLAMKDILNNFIYGIQLMSGRLRVGDWMECDGARGKVTAISYQSTQMETLDGGIMSFPNASLFNRNFKNLTRNNSYEFAMIQVGVNYGADIQKVRQVILDAMEKIDLKDQFGVDVLDRKRGVGVALSEFGESSIDVAVKQYVLVSHRSAYISQAKELIYNALNEAGIEIPFPQRDIHIIK